MSFTISIVTAPRVDLTPDDVGIVKHALLFADKVRLYSPNLALLQTVRDKTTSLDDIIKTFVESAPEIDRSFTPKKVAALKRELRSAYERPKAFRNEKQNFFVDRVESYKTQVLSHVDRMLMDSGLNEIQEAIQEGLVEIDDFGTAKADDIGLSTVIAQAVGARPEQGDQFFERYVECIGRVVFHDKSYPLTDHQVSSLIEAGVKDGIYSSSSGTSAKMRTSMLSWSILQNIPVESVDIDTVLHVRNEVEDYAVGFRSAVADFAAQMKSEAWSDDFANEADHLFQTSVLPEVKRIEQSVRASRLLTSLGRSMVDQITDKKWAMGTTGLLAGLGLAITDIPSAVVAGVAATGTGASVAIDTHRKMKKHEAEARQNGFFLYYKSEKDILER